MPLPSCSANGFFFDISIKSVWPNDLCKPSREFSLLSFSLLLLKKTPNKTKNVEHSDTCQEKKKREHQHWLTIVMITFSTPCSPCDAFFLFLFLPFFVLSCAHMCFRVVLKETSATNVLHLGDYAHVLPTYSYTTVQLSQKKEAKMWHSTRSEEARAFSFRCLSSPLPWHSGANSQSVTSITQTSPPDRLDHNPQHVVQQRTSMRDVRPGRLDLILLPNAAVHDLCSVLTKWRRL